MKKILLSVFALSIILPTLAFASFDTSLKYGSRGDAVIELQDLLIAQGFLKGNSDGRYGLVTLNAVKTFQTANGLSSDGYFGTASRAKASSILVEQLQSSNTAEQADTGTVAITSTIAGCTSTSLYSTTTGKSCNSSIISNPNFPDGCTSISGFSIITGHRCDGLDVAINNLQNTVEQIQQNTQQIAQNTTHPTPTPTPTPIVPTGPVSTTDGVDPQININMNANLDSIAKSLVTNTSCPNKPIIIFSPQNYVDNRTNQVTVVSVVGNTITFSSNQSTMLMGVSLYDPCMPSEQLTWSYTSPMTGTIGTNTNLQSPTGGMAEASIDSSSQGPQTITVTASELGGETVTKSVIVQMSSTPLVIPKQTRPAMTGSASA